MVIKILTAHFAKWTWDKISPFNGMFPFIKLMFTFWKRKTMNFRSILIIPFTQVEGMFGSETESTLKDAV